MSSPVHDLQALAQDSSTKLPDLLRRALTIATKLGLEDFRIWIESELKGYSNADVPPYRVCSGDYCVQNPYHGLQPIVFPDDKVKSLFCRVPVCDSIESLQHCLAAENDGDTICYAVPPAHERQLRKACELIGMPIVRLASTSELAGILDTVRTTLLEWALKLEAEGILGDGVMFSPEEKVKAQSSQVINIEQFHGVLGDINHSTVSHSFTQGIKKGDLESLIRVIADMGASKEDLDDLRDAIAAEPDIPPESGFGEKVSAWMGKMVAKAAQGGLQVAVQSSSHVIGAALKMYYGLT